VGRGRGVGFEDLDPTLGTPDERVTRRLPVLIEFGKRTGPVGTVVENLGVVAGVYDSGTVLGFGFVS